MEALSFHCHMSYLFQRMDRPIHWVAGFIDLRDCTPDIKIIQNKHDHLLLDLMLNTKPRLTYAIPKACPLPNVRHESDMLCARPTVCILVLPVCVYATRPTSRGHMVHPRPTGTGDNTELTKPDVARSVEWLAFDSVGTSTQKRSLPKCIAWTIERKHQDERPW